MRDLYRGPFRDLEGCFKGSRKVFVRDVEGSSKRSRGVLYGIYRGIGETS